MASNPIWFPLVLIGIVVALLALIGSLLLWRRGRRLEARIAALESLLQAPTPEAELPLAGQVQVQAGRIADLARLYLDLQRTLQRAVLGVALERYNPFEDVGGDQSFSLALVDSEGRGVVVTALYSRDGTRVYAKALDRGQPSHPLSEEEERVVQRALQQAQGKEEV